MILLVGIFLVGGLIMWANIPPRCRDCGVVYGTRSALRRHHKKAHQS